MFMCADSVFLGTLELNAETRNDQQASFYNDIVTKLYPGRAISNPRV